MDSGSDPFDESVLDKAIRFQNGLVAHATGRALVRRAKQVGGDADVEEPDRFEIGAEEQTRWTQHVVHVREIGVSRGVAHDAAARDRRGGH